MSHALVNKMRKCWPSSWLHDGSVRPGKIPPASCLHCQGGLRCPVLGWNTASLQQMPTASTEYQKWRRPKLKVAHFCRLPPLQQCHDTQGHPGTHQGPFIDCISHDKTIYDRWLPPQPYLNIQILALARMNPVLNPDPKHRSWSRISAHSCNQR